VLAVKNVVESTIWQACRVGIEILGIIVRLHVQSRFQKDLKGPIVPVAVDVTLTRGETRFAASGRHGVEVSEKQNRHVSEFRDLARNAHRLSRSILGVVRMQVGVADPDHATSEPERGEGESTGCEEIYP